MFCCNDDAYQARRVDIGLLLKRAGRWAGYTVCPQLDMTGCLFKQALIYHLPLQTLSGLRLKEFPLKSPHDALLFYARRLRLQPFLGPAALISQTVLFLTRGSRADGCSTLLLRSLGTSALWEPHLMCDDVYCLVICPLSGYQGPEHDRNCGGKYKRGSV